jgi:hypothetical protein
MMASKGNDMIRTYIPLFLALLPFPADGRQVALIDLSQVPKDQSFGPGSGAARGGGLLIPSGGWIPPHIPLSLNVRLLGFAESSNPAPWSVALEVAVTNIGTTPVWVPIGTDSTKLLAVPAKDRRYLALTVYAIGEKGGMIWIGGGLPASNADEPKSVFQLAPGDYVVYKIGLDRRVQGVSTCVQNAADDGCKVTVVVSLNQKTMDGGVDYSETISDDIKAVNSLKWTPPQQ